MTKDSKIFYPSYLDMDFDNILKTFIEVLGSTSEFKSIVYPGSNIRALAETMAYVGDLNTYYLNRTAKNLFADTVDIYENIHRIATKNGYFPKGYISSYGIVTIKLSQEAWINNGNDPIFTLDDVLFIEYGKKLNAIGSLSFFVSKDHQFLVKDIVTATMTTSGGTIIPKEIELNINVRQGEIHPLLSYSGSDLVDYKLLLPNFNFDHDNDTTDDFQTIVVMVNGVPWTRVENFFDSTITNDNIYQFIFDKYQRYQIEFSTFRNYPKSEDIIEIQLFKSSGANGNVGMGAIRGVDQNFISILNGSQLSAIDNSFITEINNTNATLGGKDPETLTEIKEKIKQQVNVQNRSVTKDDYSYWLNDRSDIVKARAWGEQEVKPTGDVSSYNKIYFSCIPNNFTSDSISLEKIQIPNKFINGTEYLEYVKTVNDNFITSLSNYLKGRKTLNTVEFFVKPQFIYFKFDIGLRVKRIYSFANVATTVRNKLNYYFTTANRNFFENINFMEIHNFILDSSIISESDNFELIKGIDNIIFRNVDVYYPYDTGVRDTNGNPVFDVSNIIYENGNSDYKYPQYGEDLNLFYPSTKSFENMLTPIQIGPHQFPKLATKLCTFVNEG